MKKSCSLFLVLLFLFFTACQPTPSEEIVHQKGAENERKWMDSVPVEEGNPSPDVPERWEEKLDLREDLKVEIQADISVPDTNAFPIYEVESADFNHEKLDNVVKILYPNARLQLQAGRKSKEDLEYEMEIETKAIENVDRNHPEFTEEERKNYIAEAQAHLQDLTKQLQQLENDSSPKTAERVSDYIHADGDAWVARFEPIDEKTNSKLGSIVLNTAPKSEKDDTTMKLMASHKGGWEIDGEVLAPDINDFEAVGKAGEKMLRYLGLDDIYQVDRVFQDKNVYASGTFVYCTRKVGDARVTYVDSTSVLQESAEEPAYSSDLSEEFVRFLFWPYGCDDFIWSGPKKMDVVENENVSLLPFETIQEKARKAFGYILCPEWDDRGEIYYRIVINDIRLGYMNVKRAGGGCSAIPVWDFFGYYYGGYASVEGSGWAKLDENNEHLFDAHGGATSMLTLNAIDGSIMNRHIGF